MMSRKPVILPEETELSLATHAQAQARIAKAKGWGGLLGLALGLLLSWSAGLPLTEAGARGLAAGIAGYLVAWLAAVKILRLMIESELRAEREQREEEMRRQQDAALAAFDETELSAA